MKKPTIHAVTGAFGYSGRYIAAQLLAAGQTVVTLTNSPRRANPFGRQIEVRPLAFQDEDQLAASLAGVDVLYNTYWVRFNLGDFSFAQAEANTGTLFSAARRAGVRRVVHVSITNPDENSPLEYFAGKARLERALRESGLSHVILRPTVLFGGEDILINNIAWALRHLPFFALFGDGDYRLQPLHVGDLASLAIGAGQSSENLTVNAIGPETFTYRELVQTVGEAIGRKRPLVAMPPALGLALGRVLGWGLRDVLITRDEIQGLMEERLFVATPPTGTTALTTWLKTHGDHLGRHYASELARRRDREMAYGQSVPLVKSGEHAHLIDFLSL